MPAFAGKTISAAAMVLILFVSLAATSFAETGDGLEGTVWKYRPKGIVSWFCFWNRDYLVFESGNFMKAGLSDGGFKPALYSAAKTGYGIKWTASLTNGGGQVIDWDGLRVSYWMTGTFKNGDRTRKWKAWQIFPKPPKSAAVPPASTASPAPPANPPPSSGSDVKKAQ